MKTYTTGAIRYWMAQLSVFHQKFPGIPPTPSTPCQVPIKNLREILYLTLLLLTSWYKTKYWDRVVLNHTLVLTRGFFSHAAECFGVRCRPTDLWLKAEVTGGKAARKKAFRVGHYKDFTEQETAHKKSLGTQGNWTTVLEKIYWRSVFLMEPRQNRELKLCKRQILSNSWLRCQKQRSLSWTQKCTKGLGSTRNQS